MKPLRTSTDTTKKRTAIYRSAARALERGSRYNGSPVSYACHALELAEYGHPLHPTEHSSLCAPMKEIFAPDSTASAWLSPYVGGVDFSSAECVRILALCFMAAMVEAGDA